jgi:hypothetical protein
MKKQSTKASIILRKRCEYHEKRGRSYPVPELLLVANKQGFLWLSKYFAAFAKANPDPGPDNHGHLFNPPFDPFDSRHSDEMVIRVAVLTPKNKREVFRRYGIASLPPFRGDLKRQYEAQIRRVIPQWRYVLRLERGVEGKTRSKKQFHHQELLSWTTRLGK